MANSNTQPLWVKGIRRVVDVENLFKMTIFRPFLNAIWYTTLDFYFAGCILITVFLGDGTMLEIFSENLKKI